MCIRDSPLVIEYNPSLPNVHHIINKYKYLVDLDPIMKEHIPSSSIIVTFSRPKNLKDILTHSKFVDKSEDTLDGVGCFKCSRNCDLCKYFLVETKSFKSYHSNKSYKIRLNLTCNTIGIIYLINDTVCHKSYVGSCITNCKTRFSNHKSHIKNKYLDCELAQHFAECEETHLLDTSSKEAYNNSLKGQIEIVIIDQIFFDKTDSKNVKMGKCKAKEGFWQTQLRTLKKFGGLNVKDDRRSQYYHMYSKSWT